MTTDYPATPVPSVGALYTLVQDLDRAGQEELFAELASRGIAQGIELPFRDSLDTDLPWLASQLRGRFTHSVVTPIPGTMQRVAADPHFGLASPDPEGRERALAFMRGVLAEVRELTALAGERVVDAVFVHSAPSGLADADAFRASIADLLAEIAASGDAAAPHLIIEHCDAANDAVPGEKRFLSIEAEVEIARELGVGVTINWGRSAVEAHEADVVLRHIRAAREAGVLAGLMLSGAGPEANGFGAAWADAHLPHTENEPTSLLDDAAIAASMSAAGLDTPAHAFDGTAGLPAATYAGIKVQCAPALSIPARIDTLARVYRGMWG
ncbi:MAG: DUF4862 family protein [Dermabacter sp.]|nr:DUF4862 family protein [Dermabacter sp.]